MRGTSLIALIVSAATPAPLTAQEVIYGIAPGEPIYRGERIYPGEPVYPEGPVYRSRRYGPAYPVPEYGAVEPMPRAVPEVRVVSPEEVAERLYRRGFRRLGPIDIDRGYYQLTAIDPAGNLIALSVSVVSGEVERSRILQARAAPPATFAGPEPQTARTSPRDGAPAVESRTSAPARVSPEPERRTAVAEPRDPPPLPRALPSRPMPVESVDDAVTTASIPDPAEETAPAADAAATPAAATAPKPAAAPAGSAAGDATQQTASDSETPQDDEDGVALSDFAEPETTGSDEASTTKSGVRMIYPPTTATTVTPEGGAAAE